MAADPVSKPLSVATSESLHQLYKGQSRGRARDEGQFLIVKPSFVAGGATFVIDGPLIIISNSTPMVGLYGSQKQKRRGLTVIEGSLGVAAAAPPWGNGDLKMFS